MKKKKKIALAISLIIIAVITVRGVLFFTAEPKVTVNYVAECNRMTRPQNFDPNENAAEDYQKTIDSFVKMPVELKTRYLSKSQDFNDVNNYPPRGGFGTSRDLKVQYIDWPTDLDDAIQDSIWKSTPDPTYFDDPGEHYEIYGHGDIISFQCR